MFSDQMILAILPLGGWELAVIIVVGMLVFYGKRLPEVGRNMGRSIVEFKKGLSGSSDDSGEKKPPAKPAQPEHEPGKPS